MVSRVRLQHLSPLCLDPSVAEAELETVGTVGGVIAGLGEKSARDGEKKQGSRLEETHEVSEGDLVDRDVRATRKDKMTPSRMKAEHRMGLTKV